MNAGFSVPGGSGSGGIGMGGIGSWQQSPGTGIGGIGSPGIENPAGSTGGVGRGKVMQGIR